MNHLEQFIDHHRDAPPLTDAEVLEMLQTIMKYGPANCWTGTTGTLCSMIHRLIIERGNLLRTR